MLIKGNWEGSEIVSVPPTDGDWGDADVVSTLPDGRVMSLDQLVDLAMSGAVDPRWRVDPKVPAALRTRMARTQFGGRASDNVIRMERQRQNRLPGHMGDALRVFLSDWEIARREDMGAAQWLADRVDRDGAGDRENKLADRIDAGNRVKAALDHLGAVPVDQLRPLKGVNLSNVLMWFVVEEMNSGQIARLFYGEEGHANQNGATRAGGMLIHWAAHELARRYGFDEAGSEQKPVTKPKRKKSNMRDCSYDPRRVLVD
jgi:hypothetical protein